MKVLQINSFYNEGSTGKITHAIHRGLLARSIASVVYYGRGKNVCCADVHRICSEFYGKYQNLISRVRGTMYGGCWYSTHKLKKYIKQENPDIVHLQCINGYFVNIYKLIRWLKECGIKTVLTLHAEFMYTANCGYALDCEKWRTGCGNCPRLKQETLSIFRDGTADSFRQMQDAFAGFEEYLTVVSVSPWLQERARRAPILENMKHVVVLNGLDTDIFYYRSQENPNTNEKVIFHATPMFSDDPEHLKGGYYVLELARRLHDLPVKFVVAGKNSLQGNVPSNVELLGNISDQQRLAELYINADLTLLTSKKETFSMVCAESLCCGTPVVGFCAGAPEQISLKEYSAFVEEGNLDMLEQNVRAWLQKRIDKTAISAVARQHYSRDSMVEQYLKIYRSMADEDTD